ncbi:Mu transposase C-terminal domain-containing protein [Aestuariispira insulae]|uniref:Putative transposase n=1 Tax=Aestuariispira insulae TaxID=1461337 RepID=A0A3D9H8M8_9PROT|nr:Mu transposase C-terminal domain-containing protein [Aestuariispira insulae]RED45854.1 putative transposase [Aestuariispira insulae]
MTQIYIGASDSVSLDGRVFDVNRVLDHHTIQLVCPRNGELRNIKFDHLAKLICLGGALVQPGARRKPVPHTENRPSVDLLSDEDKAALHRMVAYVRKIPARNAHHISNKVLGQWITIVADQIGDSLPPTVSTVRRWLHRWWTGGERPKALAYRVSQRGNRSCRFDPEVEEVLERDINDRLLRAEKFNAQDVEANVKNHIEEINRSRVPSLQLKVPGLRTIQRRISQLDPYQVMVATKGKRAADNYYRAVGPGLVAEFPLHIVQIDHHLIDLVIVDEENRVIGRCWLTMAIDLFSRMPVGIYLSVGDPSYDNLVGCLRQLILPKDSILEKHPEIASDWSVYGIPHTIVLDNDLSHHGKDFQDAANQLGFNIQYGPKWTPHYRGAIERLFRTLNTGLIHKLAGTTFSNPKERGDYKSEKMACLTMWQAEKLILKFFLDVYGKKLHSALRDTPENTWKQAAKENPVRFIDSAEELIILSSHTVTRSLSRKGILLDHLQYNCELLADLRLRLDQAEGRQRVSRVVSVKLDPTDIGHLYVKDPLLNRWITVPCLQCYAKGLSRWQHNIIRKRVRDRLNSKRKLTEEDLLKGRNELLSMIDDYCDKYKRTTRKQVRLRNGLDRMEAQMAKKSLSNRVQDLKHDDIPDFDPVEFLRNAGENGWFTDQDD